MWLICCVLAFDKAIDKGELVMDDDVAWWHDMREWHGNNPSVRAEFQMWHMVIVAKSTCAKYMHCKEIESRISEF